MASCVLVDCFVLDFTCNLFKRVICIYIEMYYTISKLFKKWSFCGRRREGYQQTFRKLSDTTLQHLRVLVIISFLGAESVTRRRKKIVCCREIVAVVLSLSLSFCLTIWNHKARFVQVLALTGHKFCS